MELFPAPALCFKGCLGAPSTKSTTTSEDGENPSLEIGGREGGSAPSGGSLGEGGGVKVSPTHSYTPCTTCGCVESPWDRPSAWGAHSAGTQLLSRVLRELLELSNLGKLRVMETKTESPNPLST